MNRIRYWTQKPSGQVLLATLLFCFIFLALFVGLYKSGLLYTAKEKASRATDLTALSAGAVYANGMQLVRLTNAILMGFAVVDIVVMEAELDITGGISLGMIESADPHTRKFIQEAQKILFGVTYPSGAYPFLIFNETLSLASDNQLKDSWPGIGSFSFNVPSLPSPILLFNLEGSSPETSILPNMALKFRTLNLLLPAMSKKNKGQNSYRLTKKDTGEEIIFQQHEVEPVPNAVNPGQMRVKKGLDEQFKFVSVIKEGEAEAEKEASQRIKKEATSKMKSLFGITNMLNRIEMDVMDRDDPPDHTVIVYSNFPTDIKNPNGSNAEVQSLSEVSVEGPGLAGWDLFKPPYQPRLLPKDPTQIAKLLDIQGRIQEWVTHGSLPKINDIFKVGS
jgi:hypothetical protein